VNQHFEKFKTLYENLSDYQMELITELRQKANELSEVMNRVKPSREASLGATNIEQGMMWIIKAVCLEKENDSEDWDAMGNPR